ncbi:MAG: hypothetical protein OXB94_13490 [Nitrospira sp.]|nr:hypothetical protein [Nitrospira sp.]
MVADPRFETLAILKLVVKQAIDGDVEALRWLEEHGFLTVHQEEGKIWLSWNKAVYDAIFFEEDEERPDPEDDED